MGFVAKHAKKPERKTINTMTLADFYALRLPFITYNGLVNNQAENDFIQTEIFNKIKSMVIVPPYTIHDSGYMCMTYIGVDEENYPICSFSGWSDVLFLDGVCGFAADKEHPSGWKIDCLPCGLVRIFCNGMLGFDYSIDCDSASVFCAQLSDRVRVTLDKGDI